MARSFKDHFSRQAADYTRYRPTYPPELFTWLASLTEGNDTAWDCGCGNGQASANLADHYGQVFATDPSSAQIANARPHPAVRYSVASAEQSGLADACVDLIVVAQALHWFDFERFYAEARRVARPGAVLAAISYGELQVAGEAGAVISRFYHETIASCWPPERRHVDEGYRNIPFPFARITPPPFAMTVQWPYEQLLGYLGTWSAVQEFANQHGHDPRTLLRAELAAVWGNPEQPRNISWPLTLLVGRIDG